MLSLAMLVGFSSLFYTAFDSIMKMKDDCGFGGGGTHEKHHVSVTTLTAQTDD